MTPLLELKDIRRSYPAGDEPVSYTHLESALTD